MSTSTEYLVPVVSHTNALLDIVQPKGEYNQPGEKYSSIPTYHTDSSIPNRYDEHSGRVMEQLHVVLTMDEAIYLKLQELRWSVEEHKDILIPCLGELHIAIYILGVIGRHMSESGLSEL